METSEKVTIRVVYYCSSTQPNQKVKLVGSIPTLGSWNPNNGIDLATDISSFPEWSSTIFIPENSSIEYKYVIVDSSTSNVVRWESIPNNGNRQIDVGKSGRFTIFESEGKIDRRIKKVRLPKQQSMQNVVYFGKRKSKRKLVKGSTLDQIPKEFIVSTPSLKIEQRKLFWK